MTRADVEAFEILVLAAVGARGNRGIIEEQKGRRQLRPRLLFVGKEEHLL